MKDLLKKCVYGTQGYIASQEDIDKVESYLKYNLDIISIFSKVIVATNYGGDYQRQYSAMWKKYFPEVILIDLEKNRGHSHGYLDLENAIIHYCKNNNIKWLCKVQNDTILTPDIFKYDLPPSDFYYINGFSMETLHNYQYDFEMFNMDWFFPQGVFYIINVGKVEHAHDETYLDECYDQIQNIEGYNNKIWEYIPNFECEKFIAKLATQNNMTTHHLLGKELYNKLFNLVKLNRIGDPSHKNIMIQGICHFHFPHDPVLEINLDV